MIDAAIQQGILDTTQWEICFVGQDAPEITFCNGAKSKNMGQFSWEQYARFLQEVDLALCLMYTPHPSYPPYDVACSGGVVVSNQYLNKQAFAQCDNVILGELDMDSMLEAMRKGVELALDTDRREQNYRRSTIERNWGHALEETLAFMGERLK